LANNLLLAPVSNANISLMADLARRNQLRFDAILSSEIAGDYSQNHESISPLLNVRSAAR
jgi:hypothetical protein